MTTHDLRKDAWRLLIHTMFAQQERFISLAADLKLNPGSLKLLSILDAAKPVPMRTLAEFLHCDASLITMLVDRLEQEGMVEREVLATDRRVKTIVLTRKGLKAQQRFRERLYEPPESFSSLTDTELNAISSALKKVSMDDEVIGKGIPPRRVITSSKK